MIDCDGRTDESAPAPYQLGLVNVVAIRNCTDFTGLINGEPGRPTAPMKTTRACDVVMDIDEDFGAVPESCGEGVCRPARRPSAAQAMCIHCQPGPPQETMPTAMAKMMTVMGASMGFCDGKTTCGQGHVREGETLCENGIIRDMSSGTPSSADLCDADDDCDGRTTRTTNQAAMW